MIFARVQASEEKMRAIQLAVIAEFKLMLHERKEITSSSRWSKVYIFILRIFKRIYVHVEC
jgi:FF domain